MFFWVWNLKTSLMLKWKGEMYLRGGTSQLIMRISNYSKKEEEKGNTTGGSTSCLWLARQSDSCWKSNKLGHGSVWHDPCQPWAGCEVFRQEMSPFSYRLIGGAKYRSLSPDDPCWDWGRGHENRAWESERLPWQRGRSLASEVGGEAAVF